MLLDNLHGLRIVAVCVYFRFNVADRMTGVFMKFHEQISSRRIEFCQERMVGQTNGEGRHSSLGSSCIVLGIRKRNSFNTGLDRTQPRQMSSRDTLENFRRLLSPLSFLPLFSLGFRIFEKIAFVVPSRSPVVSRKVYLSVRFTDVLYKQAENKRNNDMRQSLGMPTSSRITKRRIGVECQLTVVSTENCRRTSVIDEFLNQ